ncbi:DUF4258 domain-containing protein [Candidatus Micrarchaeota archaeon]|nr:DUF4258 domain-containing protein [Candidatus Micrarchaeota archaeon]MBU1930356.1 DUF4258 domain-containing protein [Candidatus Micrarchaeota archaeon]
MKIIFTKHSLRRLKQRNIPVKAILDAAQNPQKTIKKHGKYYLQKKIENGTIKIVCERKTTTIKIITVYWL